MRLDNVLCVRLLLVGEVDRERTILVGGPLKVGAKEPVHRAHEVYLELDTSKF